MVQYCKKCGAEFPDFDQKTIELYKANASKGWRLPDICPECRAKYNIRKKQSQRTPSAIPAQATGVGKYAPLASELREAYETLVSEFGGEQNLKQVADTLGGGISGWVTTLYLKYNR